MNLAEYVKLKMDETGFSATDIEKRSGKLVTDGHIAYILAGKAKNPTLKVLLGLAKGLEADPVEVFKAAASIHQELINPVWTLHTLIKVMEQATENDELGSIFKSLSMQKPAKIKAVKKLLDIE
jgi:transcriptional regulator with XRE-family HTH domain